MNTITITTDCNDAEKLALILIRSDLAFVCEPTGDDCFLFKVSEEEKKYIESLLGTKATRKEE